MMFHMHTHVVHADLSTYHKKKNEKNIEKHAKNENQKNRMDIYKFMH